MRLFFFLLSLVVLFSCAEEGIETKPGTKVSITIQDEHTKGDFEQVVEVLKSRLDKVSPLPDSNSYSFSKGVLNVELPEMRDTILVRQLIERNRMNRLCYSISSDQYSMVTNILKNM